MCSVCQALNRLTCIENICKYASNLITKVKKFRNFTRFDYSKFNIYAHSRIVNKLRIFKNNNSIGLKLFINL